MTACHEVCDAAETCLPCTGPALSDDEVAQLEPADWNPPAKPLSEGIADATRIVDAVAEGYTQATAVVQKPTEE